MFAGLRGWVLLGVCAVAGGGARGQAVSTASQFFTPSVFAGATVVSTGLNSGRNVSVTAGLDLEFRPNSKLQPSLEYRATYAVDKGDVDSLKNNLGGVSLSRHYGAFHPYVNLLAGRGETTYAGIGVQVPGKPVFYTQSSSNVFAFGGGVNVFALTKIAVKVDYQMERYSSPVTISGHLYTQSLTVGMVYALHLPHIIR